jgi:hypothetical protein
MNRERSARRHHLRFKAKVGIEGIKEIRTIQ